jgi:energy-coupling factor transporter ATP-binding protein EcfA2
MNKEQGLKIVESLRKAQAAGAPVVELAGADARNFAFVRDEATRKVLLGSFCVEAGKKFFVSVVSRESDDFGIAVYEKLKGIPVLATNVMSADGIVWTYKPTKWSGDNQARKKAFKDAAKVESLTFPLPQEDVTEFSAAVNRAIELRRSADAAGGDDPDEDDGESDATWQPPAAVLPPRSKLPPTRLSSSTVPGVVWQLCTGGASATLAQLQQAIDQLGLTSPHTSKGMLSRYATHHGCTVTVNGTGAQATYTMMPPDVTAPESDSDFEDILDHLRGESLSFSAELVASYLLALQAKRFVLLTGISGTGKTRLAQEIARVFGPTAEKTQAVAPDAFEIVTKPSQLKYRRFIVPSELAQEFDALTNPETKRIDLKVPGLPMASMAFHKNPDKGNLFYVLLSGDVREWFTTKMKVGERFLLSRKSTGEKEWLELALPSGAEDKPAASDKTYELIAVRPDWTDARALLGYYNPLTKSYISTPTLQLLLRAHAEVTAATDAAPPRPYFLIFDEMNLARVEHYFSDFLSAMECGEAIHLHDDPQLEEEEDIPRRITIPKNVFVIGTVNVDETTYMFSPKVLDRAFVLEFNDVDLKGLAGSVHAEAPKSTPLALTNLQGGLKLRGPTTEAEWQRFESVLDGAASALLHKLHAALAIENRHFGYRVARELARFVDLAVEQAGEAAAHAALDVAVLAKILPKLHGSQAEIEQTLKRLMAIAIDGKPETDVFSEHGAVLNTVAVPLPRTARKLRRMQLRLRANGFVSFIE